MTGRADYPPMEPRAGGGAMAALSFFYPTGPLDLRGKVLRLPDDGTIPEMPGWQWLQTPGHSPGHVKVGPEPGRGLDHLVTDVGRHAVPYHGRCADTADA